MKSNSSTASHSIELEFRFNSSHQLILTPKDGKGKALLQLYSSGMNSLRIVAPPAQTPEALVIEASAVDQTQDNKALLALKELLPFVEASIPIRPHLGACGPESGCDSICAELSSLAPIMRKVHEAIESGSK